ncbi:ATP-binding protein [Haloferax sp. DFSO60]|uniref:PAS domain-containing sensor histidine kinase n=1 Tax=Haloferax sp. DFSO60 TaxID=3388652 RepID=UPI00397829A9
MGESEGITVELESVPAMCALVRIDDSPRLEACNSAFEEAIGVESESLTGEEIRERVHSDDEQAVIESLLRAANGTETTFVYRARHATNGWATFEARARSHPDGVFVLARDVTDQSRQREHLDVLNRVLRHNVRNDFNVIDGHLQLIAESTAQTRLERSADAVRNAVDRWLRLTEHATRIEQLFNETAEQQLSIEQLVRGVTTASELSYPRAVFTVSIDEGVSGTASSLLEEAVHELCENAAKHTTESPAVSVTVRPGSHRHTAEITVEDDGDGLPLHEVSVLQTGEETPLVHGTGIGLQLVRMIVEHVGGTVDVDTKASGGRVRLVVPTVPAA